MTAPSLFLQEETAWILVETLGVVGDDKMRVLIVRRKDQVLFRSVAERFLGPAPEDEGVWPVGFWQPESISGYCQTADDAERIARAQFPIRDVRG